MRLFSFIYNKTTTSVLMPLSWLTRVNNFRSNLLSSFLLIVCILSSQAISFQSFQAKSFFRHSSHDFLLYLVCSMRKKKEYFWIKLIRTTYLSGLNVDLRGNLRNDSEVMASRHLLAHNRIMFCLIRTVF